MKDDRTRAVNEIPAQSVVDPAGADDTQLGAEPPPAPGRYSAAVLGQGFEPPSSDAT